MLRDAGAARLLLRWRSRHAWSCRRPTATGHGTYHFSSGKDVAIKELYDAVVRAMKLNDYPEPEMKPLGPDDAPSILLDPSRTFGDFGDVDVHAARRDRPPVGRALAERRRASAATRISRRRVPKSDLSERCMRILITGGAGCLGSNLIEHYLPQGHEILVIDNFATGRREVAARSRPRLTLVEGSVADRDLVDARLRAVRADPRHPSAPPPTRIPQNWREDVAHQRRGHDQCRRGGATRRA